LQLFRNKTKNFQRLENEHFKFLKQFEFDRSLKLNNVALKFSMNGKLGFTTLSIL